MKKTFLIVLIIVVVAGIVGVIQKNRKTADESAAKAAKTKSGPVPVVLAPVTVATVPVEVSTFGTVEPVSTVSVRSRISGTLSKVLFAEGQDVSEGALLFEIDPRGPEAELKQAEAALAKDRVQLENALKEAGRQESLLKKGIAAQDVRDEAVTAAETLKAMVQSDEALVDNARLQLSYCSIRSPVSGRTGNLLIHQGNLVKADDSTLVTINQIHPIHVRFALPQQELARVRDRIGQAGLTLLATPTGGDARVETGMVTFVDNAVNINTGTILIKARFENAGSTLWPGQFVKVVLNLARQENAVVVPESAVLFGQQGAYVYVVDKEARVAPRSVTVDRTVAGVSVIATGLVAGEVVVVDGQLRLKPGSQVVARDGATAEKTPAGRP